jgi:hypothetical protein
MRGAVASGTDRTARCVPTKAAVPRDKAKQNENLLKLLGFIEMLVRERRDLYLINLTKL